MKTLDECTTEELQAEINNRNSNQLRISREQAIREIDLLTVEAHAILAKACQIADEHQVTVNFNICYGSGSTYYPKKGSLAEEDWYGSTEGWVSSSTSC